MGKVPSRCFDTTHLRVQAVLHKLNSTKTGPRLNKNPDPCHRASNSKALRSKSRRLKHAQTASDAAKVAPLPWLKVLCRLQGVGEL